MNNILVPRGSLVGFGSCDGVSEMQLHDDEREHASVDDAVVLNRIPQLDLALQSLRCLRQAETILYDATV